MEKSYDKFIMELICILNWKNVPRCYVDILKNMYQGVVASVLASVISREFSMTIGLHRGSALSTYHFILVDPS